MDECDIPKIDDVINGTITISLYPLFDLFTDYEIF